MSEWSAGHRHPTSIDPGPTPNTGDLGSRRSPVFGWRWPMPPLGAGLLTYVLVVEAAAVSVTAVLLSRQHLDLDHLMMLAAIVGLGLGKEELTRHVERLRRRFSDTPHQNMTSVWTFSAAVVLPPGWAAVVVAVLYAYLWRRIWYPLHAARTWKVIFSAAAVTLSCHVAAGVLRLVGGHPLAGWRTVGVLVIAFLLYSMVNLGVVAGAIALMTSEHTVRRLFGTRADAALEYATLTIGAVAALLLHAAPAYLLLLVPTLVVLHRAVLTRELEEATSTDPKTGLLNATTWQRLAQTEVERATRDHTHLGILLLDLDHFRVINDKHGRPVGDAVLVAVAEQVRQQIRRYDLLGRFGGDTFVLLCPGVNVDDLRGIAERARTGVEQLVVGCADAEARVTVSIGAAHFPDNGPHLEDLLLAADNALFAAKDRDRNRVVIRSRRPGTVPVQDSSGELSN